MFKMWGGLAVLSITIIISWVGALRYVPFRSEVSAMIQNESPYVEDRKLIANELAGVEKATDRNTDAIMGLTREQYKTNALLDQLIRSIEAR